MSDRGSRPFPDPAPGRATWQFPLPDGPTGGRYPQGPLPDGSGDQDALLEVREGMTPGAVPFLLKQLEPTIAGSVHGRMHSHPYPELIGWFSTNPDDQMNLGGTVTFYLGEDLEQHSFDAPTLVYVPPGVPHGVAVYGDDVSRHLHLVDTFPEGTTAGPETEHPELDARLPDVAAGFPDKTTNPPGGEPPWNPAGGGTYGKYFFSGLHPNSVRPLPATQLRLLPGEIPDVPIEKSWLFIYTWEPEFMSNLPLHITHSHTFTENLVWFSTDPEQPHDLGMTMRVYAFDPESKRLVPSDMTKPFVSVSQRGRHLHGPAKHKDMTRPAGFIWYAVDYDPATFAKGPEYGVAMQLHNEHYTDGRFNMIEYGVAPEDLPHLAEGDGGMLAALEPHTDWPSIKGHNDVYAPKLTIPPRKRPPQPTFVELEGPGCPVHDVAAIDGHWLGKIQLTPFGGTDVELRLRTAGDRLEGEILLDGRAIDIQDGRIDDDVLTWRFEVPQFMPTGAPDIHVRAWLVDGALKGVSGPFVVRGRRKAWPTTFAAQKAAVRQPTLE